MVNLAARLWPRFRGAGLAGLLVLGLVLQASAQQLPGAVAAVIDYQRVIRESKAAATIRTQVEARRKKYQDEIGKAEARLREADKALAKQRSVLSNEAYQQKRRAFEKDVAEVQRMVADRRRELDAVSAMALAEVRNTVIQAVSELAQTRGFNLVLPTSGVLVYSPKIDLTEEILGILDARLPSVTVPDKVPEGLLKGGPPAPARRPAEAAADAEPKAAP
jgi:Skp family chaperone for outer membrane proteins